MSAELRTPPIGGTAFAAPPVLSCHASLTRRWHVDLMRVCTDACRRYTLR